MKRLWGSLLALTLCTAFVVAQKHYAVIITTYEPDSPPTSHAAPAEPNGSPQWDYLWNDTYLIWETLQQQGFDRDNIVVLFGNGADYASPNDRYVPPPGTNVTTAAATAANVHNIFNALSTTLTNDDVLLVWTMGHGQLDNNDQACLTFSNNDVVSSETFASWVNPIPHKKRIFFWAQCNSGGFNTTSYQNGK